MTDTDPLTLPHIRGLLAAIDAGDDESLPILADALEEVGDGRAAGLRRAEWEFLPESSQVGDQSGWAWVLLAIIPRLDLNRIPMALWMRLQGGVRINPIGQAGMWYPTRSAAFLALAAALTEE